MMSLIAGLPQMMLAPLPAALQWTCSLAFELMMIAALCIFCILTFTQLMPAASCVAGFYLLARAMSAIRLISDNPIVNDNALSHRVMAWLVDALALVLPALDRYTQSAWLVDAAAGWHAIGNCALQTLVYTALLVAAAMFDFYRRNL